MDLADDRAPSISQSHAPEAEQSSPRTLKRSAAQARLQSDHGRPSKPIKRRATQACQSCRTRKIRCDVAKRGPPCIHCQLDEIECVLLENRRRKNPATSDVVVAPPNHGSVRSSDLAITDDRPDISLDLSREQVLLPLDDIPISPTNPGEQPANLTSNLPSNLDSSSTQGPRVMALPAYIKPLPARFGSDDINYLYNKGALTIPSLALRDALLQSYAEYMHPFLPLLDLHDFLRNVGSGDGQHPVSLLLFQAVMFSGVATVDMSCLQAAGLTSRREARRLYFNKVRLLYDLDYEDDSIALLQALLLMTYWRENRDGRKETHHWIEIAISLAHKLGLHIDPESSTTLSLAQQKLYKRIWWSLYIRDAQIALGTQASTRIKDAEFNVAMLQLTDLELDTLPSDISCIPAECKVVRDADQQQQLGLMCIEMVRLSMMISHILSLQYGVTGSKGSIQTATMLFGDNSDLEKNQIQLTAQTLHDWRAGIPHSVQYVTPTLQDVNSGNGCLVLHRGFLHIVYYAALSCLHRSRLQSAAGNSQTVEAARKAVRLTATNITTIASALYNLKLVRFFPSPSITMLLPAIVAHISDVLAPAEFLHRNSLQDFCKCMQIMAALRDVYAAADYSTAFLQTAIERTEIGPKSSVAEGSANGSGGNNLRRRPSQVEPLGYTVGSRSGSSPQVADDTRLSPAAGRLHSNSNRGRRVSSIDSTDMSLYGHPQELQNVDLLPQYSQMQSLENMGMLNDGSGSGVIGRTDLLSNHIPDLQPGLSSDNQLDEALGNYNFGGLQDITGDFSMATAWLMGTETEAGSLL